MEINSIKPYKYNEQTTLQLLRANPKLSGNVKIVIDSDGGCYLSSFDIPNLSSNSLKKYPYIHTKTYGENLSKFYRDNKVFKSDFYQNYEKKNSLKVEQDFRLQYEDIYKAGVSFKETLLYKEKLSCFIPLWLRDNLPSKLLIFEGDLKSVSKDYTVSEWIKDYKIIKTIDLKTSKIGAILKGIVSNERFNKNPLYVSKKDGFVEYRGVSLTDGSYTSYIENNVKDLGVLDKLLLEREDILTRGFSRGGIVVNNLVNLEFLFDVEEEATIKSYFGLFVDFDEINEFQISEERANLDFSENQTKASWNAYNSSLRDVYNPLGVIVYFDTKVQQDLNEGVLEGNRMYCLEDARGNLYSVTNNFSKSVSLNDGSIILDDQYYRIKNITLEVSNFTNFEEFSTSEETKIVKTSQTPIIRLKLNKIPNDGDQIRIFVNDVNDSKIDYHTLVASSTIPLGSSLGNQFSIQGNVNNVITAIGNCLDYLRHTYYDFIYNYTLLSNNTIVIYSPVYSDLRDDAIFQCYSSNIDTPFNILENSTILDSFNYLASPINSNSVYISGSLVQAKMRGVLEGSYLTVSEGFLTALKNLNKSVYIRTQSNKSVYKDFLDGSKFVFDLDYYNNTNKNRYIFIDSDIYIPTSSKIVLYTQIFNKLGLISHFPIVDFDFNTKVSDYKDNISGNINSLLIYLTNLYGANNIELLESVYGNNSEYVLNGGEFKLKSVSYTEELLESEYDRLKENELKETAIASKVNPFIVKWVKEGYNIRQNPYKLTMGLSGGVMNFSPSFREYSNNPKFHTYEWPLMWGVPIYDISEESKYDYLNGVYDFEQHLLDDRYFSKKCVIREFKNTEIPTIDLSSRFDLGLTTYYETFFRGVQVQVRKKSNNTLLNFDITTVNIDTTFDFSDYRFIAVITDSDTGLNVKISRNDISKSIIFSIHIDFFDDFLNRDEFGNFFMDRSQFYCNTSKYVYNNSTNNLEIADVNISGAINGWDIKNGVFILQGVENNLNGTEPNFINEIQPNQNGCYNTLLINLGNDYIEVSDIIEVTGTTIKADTLVLNGIYNITVNSNVLGASATFGFILGLLADGIYTYKEGGFNYYRNLNRVLSFAYIADLVNSGSPLVQYSAKLLNGEIVYNDFYIKLIEPKQFVENVYLKVDEDERPSVLRNEYGSIGSIVKYDSEIKSLVTFKYDGEFQPKFKYLTKFSNEDDLVNSLGRNHKIFGDYLNYYSWYNKVSTNSGESVLSGGVNFDALYPKIDEICIADRYINLLNTNWSFDELREHLTKNTFKSVYGFLSYTHFRKMLGSYVLNLVETYEFNTFEFDNSIEIFEPSNINKLDIRNLNYLYYQLDGNTIQFYINVKRFLLDRLLGDFNFIKTFLESVSLEDGIIDYHDSIDSYMEMLFLNILNRYITYDIFVYEKKCVLNNTLLNDIDLSLETTNMNIKSNYNVEFTDSNDLNFRLRFNRDQTFLKTFRFKVRIR